MMAKSFGKYGDKLTLISPLHQFDRPSQVRFRYYVERQDPRTSGSLTVHLLSTQKAPVRTLFGYGSNKFNAWTTATVCVPSGKFYLMFKARLGQPFESDVMLDEVFVNRSSNVASCGFEDSISKRGMFTAVTQRMWNSSFVYIYTVLFSIINGCL